MLTKAFIAQPQYSWVPSTFNGQGEACLWDNNLNKKPAYTSLVNHFQSVASQRGPATTSTSTTSTTSSSTRKYCRARVLTPPHNMRRAASNLSSWIFSSPNHHCCANVNRHTHASLYGDGYSYSNHHIGTGAGNGGYNICVDHCDDRLRLQLWACHFCVGIRARVAKSGGVRGAPDHYGSGGTNASHSHSRSRDPHHHGGCD